MRNFININLSHRPRKWQMDKHHSSSPRLHQWVNNLWYSDNKLALFLLPLSGIFFLLSSFRKFIHRNFPGVYTKFPVPIIIVGNVSVGGSGKTPMVIQLAQALALLEYRVGISSRGYGRQLQQTILVNEDHESHEVGDEPLLIYLKTQCPVIVGSNRKDNIQSLINDHNCNVIICDDGLQDYRFNHDVEIIMIDGERLFGNGYLLPAGPLRESVQRLNSSHFNVVTSNVIPAISSDYMKLECRVAVKMDEPSEVIELSAMKNKKAHAFAGIGHPERFFSMLESFGITVIKHPMPDHYEYTAIDLEFSDNLPIFMTEKDAVKCRHIGDTNIWSVPLETHLPESFVSRVHDIIKR